MELQHKADSRTIVEEDEEEEKDKRRKRKWNGRSKHSHFGAKDSVSV